MCGDGRSRAEAERCDSVVHEDGGVVAAAPATEGIGAKRGSRDEVTMDKKDMSTNAKMAKAQAMFGRLIKAMAPIGLGSKA